MGKEEAEKRERKIKPSRGCYSEPTSRRERRKYKIKYIQKKLK